MIHEYSIKFLMNEHMMNLQARQHRAELERAAAEQPMAERARDATVGERRTIDVFGAWRSALKRTETVAPDPIYTTAELRCVTC